VAHTAEPTNRSIFGLTIATVVAQPITIIAGLLGMNVGGISWNQDPNGFWFVVAIVAIFMVIAGWYSFIKQRA
jgi:zinc transporter